MQGPKDAAEVPAFLRKFAVTGLTLSYQGRWHEHLAAAYSGDQADAFFARLREQSRLSDLPPANRIDEAWRLGYSLDNVNIIRLYVRRGDGVTGVFTTEYQFEHLDGRLAMVLNNVEASPKYLKFGPFGVCFLRQNAGNDYIIAPYSVWTEEGAAFWPRMKELQCVDVATYTDILYDDKEEEKVVSRARREVAVDWNRF